MTHQQYVELDAEDVDWDLALRRLESEIEHDAIKRAQKD